jgi:DNA (cytosine-5)-methyltransferase 1
MKVVDLFCGCGGMGLGFQQAGFDIVYACDFDKFAINSYQHNVGSHATLADICNVVGTQIPKADVWTFGFPCQDLSIAGKQAGMEVGTRSGLFYEVMRLLDEVAEKPTIIMAENVKGLKNYLPVLEEEFQKRGYRMSVQLYNSKYWGVPQNRERYYVVGYKSSIELPTEVKEVSSKLFDVLESNVPEKYFIPKEKAQKILERAAELFGNPQDAFITSDGVSFCSTSRYWKGIAVSTVGKYRDTHVIPQPGSIRKLTPREYARLQGFPESYEIVVSDMQAYKQFGNSVTVPLVKAIAEKLKEVLQ